METVEIDLQQALEVLWSCLGSNDDNDTDNGTRTVFPAVAARTSSSRSQHSQTPTSSSSFDLRRAMRRVGALIESVPRPHASVERRAPPHRQPYEDEGPRPSRQTNPRPIPLTTPLQASLVSFLTTVGQALEDHCHYHVFSPTTVEHRTVHTTTTTTSTADPQEDWTCIDVLQMYQASALMACHILLDDMATAGSPQPLHTDRHVECLLERVACLLVAKEPQPQPGEQTTMTAGDNDTSSSFSLLSGLLSILHVHLSSSSSSETLLSCFPSQHDVIPWLQLLLPHCYGCGMLHHRHNSTMSTRSNRHSHSRDNDDDHDHDSNEHALWNGQFSLLSLTTCLLQHLVFLRDQQRGQGQDPSVQTTTTSTTCRTTGSVDEWLEEQFGLVMAQEEHWQRAAVAASTSRTAASTGTTKTSHPGTAASTFSLVETTATTTRPAVDVFWQQCRSFGRDVMELALDVLDMAMTPTSTPSSKWTNPTSLQDAIRYTSLALSTTEVLDMGLSIRVSYATLRSLWTVLARLGASVTSSTSATDGGVDSETRQLAVELLQTTAHLVLMHEERNSNHQGGDKSLELAWSTTLLCSLDAIPPTVPDGLTAPEILENALLLPSSRTALAEKTNSSTHASFRLSASAERTIQASIMATLLLPPLIPHPSHMSMIRPTVTTLVDALSTSPADVSKNNHNSPWNSILARKVANTFGIRACHQTELPNQDAKTNVAWSDRVLANYVSCHTAALVAPETTDKVVVSTTKARRDANVPVSKETRLKTKPGVKLRRRKRARTS